MSKYPQEWINAAKKFAQKHPEKLLQALYQAGALRDEPRPQAYFLCQGCLTAYRCVADFQDDHTEKDDNHKLLVVEVTQA